MNQTNLISIIILLVILFSFRKSYGENQKRNRFFFMLIWTNIGLLIFDTLLLFFGTSVNNMESLIYKGLVLIYFLFQILIVILWGFYIDYHLNGKVTVNQVVLSVAIPAVLAMITLSVMSLFGNYLFQFDSDGLYQRGSLFWVFPIFSLLVFAYTVTKILEHQQTMHKSDLFTLLIFPIAPMVAALLQIIESQYQLIWPSMTVSILILYIYVQSKASSTDPLTGVYNRMEYEHRIGQILHQRSISKTVGSILIDINDLKKINDENSHSAGDNALLEIGGILRRSVRKNDQVFRIGGDEFFILVDTDNEDILRDIMARIIDQLKYVNLYRKDIQLNLSYGYGVFIPAKYATFYDFFDEIDKKMYQYKMDSKKEQSIAA
jgi:diguanylate cyclase (GGDEF)-like protein